MRAREGGRRARARAARLWADGQRVSRNAGSSCHSPRSCATARYLVWHDDRTTSGFGWNAYLLFYAFLLAFIEDRVLIEAGAVDPRWRQHWCSDPPYSLKCFFRGWSRCEAAPPAALSDLASLPAWSGGIRRGMRTDDSGGDAGGLGETDDGRENRNLPESSRTNARRALWKIGPTTRRSWHSERNRRGRGSIAPCSARLAIQIRAAAGAESLEPPRGPIGGPLLNIVVLSNPQGVSSQSRLHRIS